MVLFNRALLSIALAFGLASASTAATMPHVKVFDGTVMAILSPDPADANRLDAFVLDEISGPGGSRVEISILGGFGLSPLGSNVSGFILNIFDLNFNEVLSSDTLLGAPLVSPGPIAEVLFSISSGSILQQFKPTGLLRLSDYAASNSTVDVEVFLSPIPLPAAAPMLLGGIAALALVRTRRRA